MSNGRLRQSWAAQGGVTQVFSRKVADYIASRPGYPAEVQTLLREALARQGVAAAQAVVADLGAGTGLFTAGLLGWAGTVIAVEPNEAMRAAADAWLGAAPGYRSLGGSAEASDLPAASVHLITAAQCAHWWDVTAARAECARVLRPGGLVALVWNDRLEGDPLHHALNEVFARFGGEHRAAMVAVDAQRDPLGFLGGTPQAHTWPHRHRLDRAGLQALGFSRSYMPARDSEAGRAAEAALDALFDAHATQGLVDVRYTTRLWLGPLA